MHTKQKATVNIHQMHTKQTATFQANNARSPNVKQKILHFNNKNTNITLQVNPEMFYHHRLPRSPNVIN